MSRIVKVGGDKRSVRVSVREDSGQLDGCLLACPRGKRRGYTAA